MNADEFKTARLHMRRLSEDDEALYCGLYTDVDTMWFIDTVWTSERAVRIFRKVLTQSFRLANGPKYFVAEERATRVAIGLCAIQPPDQQKRQAEVGMMLKSEARAQGYATEALAGLITAAFLTFPIDRVWVQYSPEHVAAERLVIRLGLALCADVDSIDKRGTNRVREIERSIWVSNSTTNQQGEHNVGCHLLS